MGYLLGFWGFKIVVCVREFVCFWEHQGTPLSVFSNAYRKIKALYVILSEVELFLSEERGKSARLLADAGSRLKSRWLVLGCYIRVSKSPRLVKRSLRRFGALLPLVRQGSTRGSSTPKNASVFLRSE